MSAQHHNPAIPVETVDTAAVVTEVRRAALADAILNSANFSSIATDEKGVIQLFNVGAERTLGYTALEVVGKITLADISDPQEAIARAKALSLELATPIAPGFEALVFKASHGVEDIRELTYIRKDGIRFPAVVSVTAVRDAPGGTIGYLLIGTDDTARKQAAAGQLPLNQGQRDQQIEALIGELERARAAAEKADLAKTDFLSRMSHDLRAPLNTILGFAQLIDTDIPPPTLAQTASVEQILRAGWYLLGLIDKIVDLGQLDSDKLGLSIEPTSLTEVLRECQAMIVPQGRKRGIEMTFPQSRIAYFVNADRTRLKQVLISLLSNAIKYNRLNGTVVVKCAMATGESTPERVRVSIGDTGEGLSPDMLRQLFQPFNRLGRERSAEDGTGTGLVTSKRLVELMGGVIGVESNVGLGSMFWFELNSVAEPRLEGDEAHAAMVEVPVRHGAPLRSTLLYVEDNPANRNLIEQLIARSPNMNLLTAIDAREGIRMALAKRPDVIVMDINLPGISGIEALKILREDPATAHIPVVALSANALPREIEQGLKAGFFRYLTKPIKFKEFMETLEVALEFAALGRTH